MPSLTIASFTFRQIMRTRFYWVATILAILFTFAVGTAIPLLVHNFAQGDEAALHSTRYTDEETGEVREIKVFWDGRAKFTSRNADSGEKEVVEMQGTFWRSGGGKPYEQSEIMLLEDGKLLFRDAENKHFSFFREYRMGENAIEGDEDAGQLIFEKDRVDGEEVIRCRRVSGDGEEIRDEVFRKTTAAQEVQGFNEGMRYLVHGGIILIGNLIAIFLSMNLLPIEIVNRSIYNLISKPLGRGDVLFGKLFGIWGVCLLYAAILSTVGVLALFIGGMGYIPLIWRSVFVGGISMLCFSAFTMALSTLMRGVGAGFITLIVYLWSSNMGVFMTLLFGWLLKIQTVAKVIINVLPPTSELGRYALWKLVDINVGFSDVEFPNGEPANLREQMELARSISKILGPNAPPVEGLIVMLIYLAVVLFIAWLLFRRREFN
jgi:ABC-type transport system involved in multi-copper enzyme maturation permease subunit